MFSLSGITPETFLLAFIGGFLPAIIWLLFWLREDHNPEPSKRIRITFIFGMFAVIVAIPLELYTVSLFKTTGNYIYIFLAIIEEAVKYGAAYFAALKSRDNDEPIDNLIYMITAALGFSALENTLFLLTPIGNGEILKSIVAGNMRFMGATLLHIISSSTIGIFLAFSFCKKLWVKRIYLFVGFITAVTLHSIFNLSIIESDTLTTFVVFSAVWFSVVILLVLFEKIKSIKLNKIN
ncbi:MAG: PrsW family glutamic-type intramembrane protease [Candidatus Paceibacterota bacterium]